MPRLERPAWTRNVAVGDVLSNGHIDRVVRSVSHKRGELMCVVFVIRHCSWTKRGYTYYGWYDLKNAGYEPTGVKVKLDFAVDKIIENDLLYKNRFNRQLGCCDVAGIP